MSARNFRVNRQIRIPEVRLIDHHGNQIGVVRTDDFTLQNYQNCGGKVDGSEVEVTEELGPDEDLTEEALVMAIGAVPLGIGIGLLVDAPVPRFAEDLLMALFDDGDLGPGRTSGLLPGEQ